MAYKKPQDPLTNNGFGIYPLTTADQVILSDGSRLEKNGVVSVNVATAVNSSKLGGKAPEYYLQPRNLLDNSDFTNPVNQRGKTNYDAIGYTIDRWLKESTSIVSIGNEGITINNTSNTKDEVFIQKTDDKTAQKLVGKVVTIAACMGDGTVYCGNGTVTYDTPVANVAKPDFQLCLCFFSSAKSYQVARLIVHPGKNVTIKWIALYEGSYTAETLPPYVPKGYAAELVECMRYFQKLSDISVPWFAGWTVLAGHRFAIPMRVAPNITLYDAAGNAGYVSGWGQHGKYKATSAPAINRGIIRINTNIAPDADTMADYSVDASADL